MWVQKDNKEPWEDPFLSRKWDENILEGQSQLFQMSWKQQFNLIYLTKQNCWTAKNLESVCKPTTSLVVCNQKCNGQLTKKKNKKWKDAIAKNDVVVWFLMLLWQMRAGWLITLLDVHGNHHICLKAMWSILVVFFSIEMPGNQDVPDQFGSMLCHEKNDMLL